MIPFWEHTWNKTSTKKQQALFLAIKKMEEAPASLLTESSVVTLNVGGTQFTTTLQTLLRDPNSMLGRMFSQLTIPRNGEDLEGLRGRQWIGLTKDSAGNYFIDRDSTHFRYILNFLRDGFLEKLPSGLAKAELRREADFYQIQGLIDAIEGWKTRSTVQSKSQPSSQGSSSSSSSQQQPTPNLTTNYNSAFVVPTGDDLAWIAWEAQTRSNKEAYATLREFVTDSVIKRAEKGERVWKTVFPMGRFSYAEFCIPDGRNSITTLSLVAALVFELQSNGWNTIYNHEVDGLHLEVRLFPLPIHELNLWAPHIKPTYVINPPPVQK